MSSKTRIFVLHRKELLYTGIFAGLGILLLIMLALMFLPFGKNSDTPASAGVLLENTYIPGVYTTSLVLNDQTVEVEVIVDKDSIRSISLIDPQETLTEMYPLLLPTFEGLREQILQNQSLDDISYETTSRYTALVLLEAIRNSLDKAK